MKIGKKEFKITKKRAFLMVSLIFLIAGLVILLLFMAQSSLQIIKYEKIQMPPMVNDIKFPGSVWKSVEEDLKRSLRKNDPPTKAEEKIADSGRLVINKKEIEAISKRLPHIHPFPFTVYLTEKTQGVLGSKNYEINFPEKGGVLDLSHFVTEKIGSFYLKVIWDFKKLPLKNSKIYFVSRSKIRRIGEKTLGSGCDHFFDLTNYWVNSIADEGLFLNNTDARHISLLSGTYFLNVYVEGKLYSAQFEIFDSNRRDLLCH